MNETSFDTPPKKKGGALKILVSLLLALIILAAAMAGGGYFYAKQQLIAEGPVTQTGDDRIVAIPSGASVARMSDVLLEAGAIKDKRYFRLAAKFLKAETSMKAGEFAIPSGASLKEIVEILEEGKSLLYPVTIPEGLTSAMILQRLANEEILTGEVPADIAEGVMLPDTYMVVRGESRANVIKRMIAAQNILIEQLWAERQGGIPIETKRDAIILASIVEKETGLAEERPEVAAVFTNRLKRSMRLETDPTIIYGVCMLHPDRCNNGRLIDKNGNQRGIRRSELNMETGYNTYRIPALPPGPICNPGKEAIAAVLNPPQSKYIFFVADGSGGHAFAVTHAQHLQNVANWRRIEREKKQ
ncbi:endolytic transglycosylase MltG [Hirschia baltica]|uniref:Endolytic murein transglycosylase n=1 Tax=Hirschia baltica (strain ATCC 49814 / DSM 5838 / IFAM 1418) TaxID=582402 RepID=C6XKQ3_HIRBI|nr:endolytic transglycosylase MltG [Hirschia baltica]ACT59620.1 aminodeoxychorismate lyase [Hirschia baltica ATCC 49814]